jgi:hypothetical protein
MYNNFQKYLQEEIQGIKDAGLYKNERVIITPQSSAIKTAEAGDVLNFCANNYLGLADSPILIEQLRHLSLRKPHSLVVHLHWQGDLAVLRLEKHNFVLHRRFLSLRSLRSLRLNLKQSDPDSREQAAQSPMRIRRKQVNRRSRHHSPSAHLPTSQTHRCQLSA